MKATNGETCCACDAPSIYHSEIVGADFCIEHRQSWTRYYARNYYQFSLVVAFRQWLEREREAASREAQTD